MRYHRWFPFGFVAAVVLVSGVYFFLLGQTDERVIENPEKPISADAGRVVQLEEQFRIHDGDGFFFIQPSDMKVAADGTIFYADLDEKVYMFDPSGKFLKNLVRRGEGPGEIRELNKIFLRSDALFVFDSMSNKAILLDKNGQLIRETYLGKTRFDFLLAAHNDRFFALDFMWQELKRKSGINLSDRTLHIIDEDGTVQRTSMVFPIKVKLSIKKGSFSMYNINNILSVFDGCRYLYLVHSSDYAVKQLDLDSPDTIKSFIREYKPIKVVVPKEKRRQYPDHYKDQPEHHNDIQKLLICKDKLLVLTSTIEKDKGILTDVFDQQGRYIDSFYLPLFRWEPGWWGYPPAAIVDDFLYTVEWDDSGTIFIVKYLMIDKSGALNIK